MTRRHDAIHTVLVEWWWVYTQRARCGPEHGRRTEPRGAVVGGDPGGHASIPERAHAQQGTRHPTVFCLPPRSARAGSSRFPFSFPPAPSPTARRWRPGACAGDETDGRGQQLWLAKLPGAHAPCQLSPAQSPPCSPRGGLNKDHAGRGHRPPAPATARSVHPEHKRERAESVDAVTQTARREASR